MEGFGTVHWFMPTHLEPIGFWSYTSLDDKLARRQLSQLRDLLANELQRVIGKPKVHIFQDISAIPLGSDWLDQIHDALGKSSFFVPIVTPLFLASEMCCLELMRFREREAELGRKDLIFPFRYVDVSDIEPEECHDPDVLTLLKSRQWIDFEPLQFYRVDSEEVMTLLNNLARSIRSALRRPVDQGVPLDLVDSGELDTDIRPPRRQVSDESTSVAYVHSRPQHQTRLVPFVDPKLQSAVLAWRLAPDIRTRAQADNIWFEERVGASRQAEFEDIARGSTTPEELRRRHQDYFQLHVTTDSEIPSTFLTSREPADLGSAIIDENQFIACLVPLWRTLHALDIDPTFLRSAFETKNTAVIEKLLDQLNRKRDNRPTHGVWWDEVLDELNYPDWADRLRDRMGLAHLTAVTGPEPVLLLRYSVRDVKAEAPVPIMFTAPTVLDGGPWEFFFPAPRELISGRAMALTPLDDEKRLLAEMLHTRLTYKPHHIARLGFIERPPAEYDLKELRNRHLLAIQVASNREDFGEDIP